ncbi:unnamed protein product [Closterium sp. NIES-53]
MTSLRCSGGGGDGGGGSSWSGEAVLAVAVELLGGEFLVVARCGCNSVCASPFHPSSYMSGTVVGVVAAAVVEHLCKWYVQRGASRTSARCPYVIRTGIAAAALCASESGTLPGTTRAEALHAFTLDSGASACFFRDSTTLTPLSAPVPVRLADPSGGPVVAHSSTILSCPAVLSGSLSCLHLPSFSTNLVSAAALRDAMVTTTTPRGSSLYRLTTEPPQVAASAQVSVSGQVATSCSCRLLSHQTLLWHHRLGHPSLPRLRGMHSRLLVSGLPRSVPPLPPSPAPPCLPCVEGRQRAAPHSSSFPPTTAPLQTLHMGVKGQVVDVLIPWIRTVRLQLRERFGHDLRVLCLHSNRGGEFSSKLLRDFCHREGILQSFTIPDSPQQNGIAERRIGVVMEVARTSMIHAAAPHFLRPFAVQYAAHQLNLWPHVSLPETSPTLRWTEKVGDASVFRVKGSRAFVRDQSADKLFARAIPCVFLYFVPDAPGWQFYHPTSRRVLPSQDVTFDESVPFLPSLPLQLCPSPSPAALPCSRSPFGRTPPSSRSCSLRCLSGRPPGAVPGEVAGDSGDATGTASRGCELRGAGRGGAETGGAEPGGVEPGGAEPRGAASSGGSAGASARLSPQQLREWFVRRTRLRSGATRAGGAGAGGAGVAAGADVTGGTAATGPGGARTRGTRAAGTGVVGGARAGDPMESGGAGAGGSGTRGAGAGGAGVGGTSAGGTGVGGTGAGGAGAGGAGAVDLGGTVRPRPYFIPLLQQVLGTLSSTGLTPILLCPPPEKSQPPLQPASPHPAPSPYTEQSGGLTERREPAHRPVSSVRTARHVPRSRPPPVPCTHAMTLRPSSVPLCVPLPAPTMSSLPEVPDPESDCACAASPTVARLLTTAVTDPSFESAAASALVTELLDFASACHLDYASPLDAESTSASPPFVGGEGDYGSLLLSVAGSHGCRDGIFKYTGTYVDKVPPPGANIVDGMWIFRVKRPQGSPPAFKARYVAQGFSERQGVDYIQTFSTTPKMTTLRMLLHVAAQHDYELHSLDFSTAFLQGSLHEEIWLHRPPGGFLQVPSGASGGQSTVTARRLASGTTHSGLHMRLFGLLLLLRTRRCFYAPTPRYHRSTSLCTRSCRKDTPALTWVLQRFGFQFSSPQPTPLSTGHSLSAPPSDEFVEPNGPYPELVGCLMYRMTCTRPDLAYPLILLARYVAPGRHRKS